VTSRFFLFSVTHPIPLFAEKASGILSLSEHQKLLVEKFYASQIQQELQSSLERITSSESDDSESKRVVPARPLNPFQQIYVLSSRTFVNFYRDPLLMYTQYGLAIVLAR